MIDVDLISTSVAGWLLVFYLTMSIPPVFSCLLYYLPQLPTSSFIYNPTNAYRHINQTRTVEMPITIVASKKEFDDLLKSHPYAVVYATASWCGPCKAIAPIFDKHANAYDIPEKIAFIKFDTDDVPDIAQELGIRSIPAFFAFEEGEKVDNLAGANPPALQRLIAGVHEKARA